MSKSDLKAITYLTFIKYLSTFLQDEELYEIAKEIALVHSYQSTGSLTEKQEKRIRKTFTAIDKYSQEVTMQVSHTFVYSTVMYVSEIFLCYIKDQNRRRSWEKMKAYAKSKIPKNYMEFDEHTLSSQDLIDFIEEQINIVLQA